MSLVFLGTLHANLTDHDELREVLGGLKPERLLVEICQEDVDQDKFETYPDEMVAALAWARENDIPVYGFDVKIDVLAEGKMDADNQAAIEEQKKVLAGKSWKDANKKEVRDQLVSVSRDLIDPSKELERRKAMLDNIKKNLDPEARNVIVTGAGHLDYFQKAFPEAEFPLSDEKVTTVKS